MFLENETPQEKRSMKIAELKADLSLRESEFPVCKERIFLAHAAVSALPSRVARAMNECTTGGTRNDQEMLLGKLLYETRQLAATILDASVGEIALVGPTSLALSYVAAGLPFKAGDSVLVYVDDYPSNVYPWIALREKGVNIRFLKTPSLGKIEPEQVFEQIDKTTRLVALASCHFISGWKIDLDTIGQELRRRDIWFCVDAIQTVGAFPTNVRHVDFLAADAHKWLLGPCSAGILYVRKELQDTLKPVVFGWHNVDCPDFIAGTEINLKADARRYEAGTHNIVGTAGLKAAMELLTEVGIANIGNELLRLRRDAEERLIANRWKVLHHDSDDCNRGGMFSFFKPDKNMAAAHQALLEKGISISLRTSREGQRYLRASPHFYNTDAELDKMIAALS